MDLEEVKTTALAKIETCSNIEELERLDIEYLGRKGKVRELFNELPKAPPDKKPILGTQLNELKNIITQRIAERKESLSARKTETKSTFDYTLPGKKFVIGKRHPVYKTMEDIEDVFIRLGFDIVYGPEIETQYNNFEALNIPLDHPSRDAFDTFYLAEHDKLLLRSHTSPVQIRTMLKRKPPLRIIAPGKVFRPDTPDASHSPMFHQVEGLVVGEDITFANLKGVLELFAQAMFGKNIKMRFRPSFFPFTEPSAEVDISCLICGGKGCSACKNSGWMEILGSGMVHPNVFRAVGYDPEKYTGFAFGMGVERIAMLRHRITDIRLFTENRASFLKQF